MGEQDNQQEDYSGREWAERERRVADWLRLNAAKLGVDTAQYIRGQLLTCIVGDDSNCFVNLRFISPKDLPKFLEGGRLQLLERVSWELGAPELPDDIKQELLKIQEHIQKHSWNSLKDAGSAEIKWRRAKDYTQQRINQDPNLAEAVSYYHQQTPVVNNHYHKAVRLLPEEDE